MAGVELCCGGREAEAEAEAVTMKVTPDPAPSGSLNGSSTVHEFTFNDVSFSVPTDDGERVLLQNISGAVPSGTVLAILGPSGAGKTTLINLLTMDPAAGDGTPRGDVFLNGHALTRDKFIETSAVVTQKDFHWAFLTCRETLVYAAALFNTAANPEETANELLSTLGLTSCADTIVGNEFLQGLSGGQKRRLSIALALIKKPLLLFLDEPTSGLDAAAAAGIMTSIRTLAHDANIIAIATIHQPSAAVYRGFDQVMVLSLGKIAYLGAADDAGAYFESIGFPVPINQNPAEFMLDIVNCDFTDQDTVETILGKFDVKRVPVQELPLPEQRIATSCWRQFCTLMQRHTKLIWKDPVLYIGRMLIFMVATAFFALVYIDARRRVQDQAIYRLFLIMWIIGVPTSLGVAVVFVSNGEFNAIRKEVRNGMVSTLPYVAAKSILDIPIMVVMAIFALTISGYAMLDFYGPNYLTMILLYAMTLYAFECAAHFMSVVVENPLLGMLSFMNVWFSAFLFAGVMVPEEQVVWPLKLLCSVLPLKWALRGMAWIEMSPTTWEGASSCTVNTTGCLSHDGKTGYTCDAGTDNLRCMGHTGEQVLDSIGMTYRSISSDDTVFSDTMIVLAIAVVFKVAYVAVFTFRVHKFVFPQPPLKANAKAD